MGKTTKTISIIGAGAMGWAIGFLISTYRKGKVKLWDRDPDLVSEIRKTRKNLKYSVPEIELPKEVLLFTDLEETIRESDLVLLAVPSFALREICQKISYFSLPPLLLISKGMDKETSLLPYQVVEKVLGKKDLLHLTGVGFAKEVHKKIPVREVLASEQESLLTETKGLFETEWLTIETSTDLRGVQLAGVLKNVMVIGIGLAQGVGENPEIKTGLIAEGVREMIELGKVIGAKEKTFWGPAGKGDLEISADPLSRNYRYGKGIYQRGIKEVKKELKEKNITVEGFHTAFAVHQLAKEQGVQLPIVEEVYRVIYEEKDPELSVKELLKLIS